MAALSSVEREMRFEWAILLWPIFPIYICVVCPCAITSEKVRFVPAVVYATAIDRGCSFRLSVIFCLGFRLILNRPRDPQPKLRRSRRKKLNFFTSHVNLKCETCGARVIGPVAWGEFPTPRIQPGWRVVEPQIVRLCPMTGAICG